MTITDRINAALVKFLKAQFAITAVTAKLDESIMDTDGCSCCHSASLSFDIAYKTSATQKGWQFQGVSGDVIEFLPQLDEYDTED
jgi:hypothetical protein